MLIAMDYSSKASFKYFKVDFLTIANVNVRSQSKINVICS